MKNALILVILTLGHSLFGQVHVVKQDSTGDFIHIQDGINASSNGDTVLIYPGIYIENIDFDGKNITLGSLTLTTGDESYISQTVIDGNKEGSCIRIDSDETNAIVNGLTLTNGSGTNTSSYWNMHSGGGVFARESTIELSKLNIISNEVLYAGGGISMVDVTATIEGVTIRNNHSFDIGGGVSIGGYSNVVFDTNELCNIYDNYAAKGNDIIVFSIANVELSVDTFSVLNPSHYHFYYSVNQTPGTFIFSILNSKHEIINSDLYVSPFGDNTNTGITPSEPLRSINLALSIINQDTAYPKTIFLAPGSYTPSSGTSFPLTLRSHVNIEGSNRDSVFLNPEFIGNIFRGNYSTNTYSVSNASLTNGNGNYYMATHVGAIEIGMNHDFVLDNLYFENNFGGERSCLALGSCHGFTVSNCEMFRNYGGPALSITQNSLFPGVSFIENCVMSENVEENGPNLYAGGSIRIAGDNSPTGHSATYIINCHITDNHSYLEPTGYKNLMKFIYNAKAFVVNSTIGNNYIDHSPRGHIVISDQSELCVYNSILYGNSDPEIYMIGNDNGDAKLFMYNSILQGGEEGILFLDPNHYVHFDSTCSIEDPLWDGQGYFPYMLTACSPCIDAGTLNLPDSITLPETDLSGNPRIFGSSVDMGAYEYGPWVGVNYQPPPSAIQCQPNPFRPETTITYSTKSSGLNELDIYNIKGFKIRTLVNQYLHSGNHELRWDGKDDNGGKLPAGLYIVYLKVDGKRIGDERLIKLD